MASRWAATSARPLRAEGIGAGRFDPDQCGCDHGYRPLCCNIRDDGNEAGRGSAALFSDSGTAEMGGAARPHAASPDCMKHVIARSRPRILHELSHITLHHFVISIMPL